MGSNSNFKLDSSDLSSPEPAADLRAELKIVEHSPTALDSIIGYYFAHHAAAACSLGPSISVDALRVSRLIDHKTSGALR